MLTRKQHQLLVFINDRLQSTGVSPSFDEMKEALALKSKSGIHRLITALEERGFIRRLAHRARALEVVRMPEDMASSGTVGASGGMAGAGIGGAQADRPASRGFAPNVIPGNFPRATTPQSPREHEAEQPAGETVQLPLYGRIAAGTPIEALRDYTNTVGIPASMIGTGTHYALEVAGDSMVDAGILDGDTVVIQRCETAENGTIVVALIEENEVTLKRLRRRGHAVALEPANPNYETRIFGPDQVKIQGKLVGLMREY